MSLFCPKCNGTTYHDDHDDLSTHAGDENTGPICQTCPVQKCDNCDELMAEPTQPKDSRCTPTNES